MSNNGLELKKATKLAKLALDFSRKRGKVVHADTDKSPFILRNQTGLCITFSGRGLTKTCVGDGSEVKFEMTPYHHEVGQNLNNINESRFSRYDGRFPKLDIELDLKAATHIGANIFAEPIKSLPTDKVGRSMQRAFVWQERGDSVVSTHVDLMWTVELEENRRMLTLSSAVGVHMYGCGPDIEVGVRLNNGGSTNIHSVGCTSIGSIYYLPVWVESCFCNVSVFIRPVTNIGADSYRMKSTHEWSSYPVLELFETETSVNQEVYFASNTDSIEVHYEWVTNVDSLGGVHCALGMIDHESLHQPVWMQCTYSKEFLRSNVLDVILGTFGEVGSFVKIVTMWPSISIRNMLP